MSNRARIFLALMLAAGVTGCDQATKIHALAGLTDTFHAASGVAEHLERLWTRAHPSPTRVVEIVPGFWEHRYVENPGSAFSLWPGSRSWAGRFVLLLIRGVLAVMLLIWLARTRGRMDTVGIACILGGAVGNLLDGVRFGYVIDFVYWHVGDSFSWPVFNIADVAISAGTGLLVLASWRKVAGPWAPTSTRGAGSPG